MFTIIRHIYILLFAITKTLKLTVPYLQSLQAQIGRQTLLVTNYTAMEKALKVSK